MPLLPRIASFWNTLAHGRRLDSELDEELRLYLDEQIDRQIARGLDPRAARRAAILEMGGVDQVKERVRDARIGRLADEALRDIAYAWRMLRQSPGFAAAAIATLALGVGANTAIFSVVNALLIAPLPYVNPSRLVFVWADQAAAGWARAPLSAPELIDLDVRSSRFEGFAGIWATTAALTGERDPEQLRIGLVTTDFFSILGAEAAIGRTFAAQDDAVDTPGCILLSHAVWLRRFGGNTNIVGTRIEVNGSPTTVVGVMPASFRLVMPPDAAVPDDLQAWQPLERQLATRPRGQRFLRVIGRAREGVDLASAQADIARVGREISREFTHYGAAGRKFETVALQADAVREIRGPLLAVFAGVGIILLIACVNVASLLIARAAARAKETAVRVALGAGLSRLVHQHVVEGLLLTALGVAAGLLLGRWGLAVLVAIRPEGLGRLAVARIDMTVVAFTCGTMFVWGLLLSLAPLSEVLRVSLASALRVDARRAGGAPRQPVHAALIVSQVALSVVLLVGALLFVRTFINVQGIDPGFRADGVQSFRLTIGGKRYETWEATLAWSRRLQAELTAMPGVIGAASISQAPYDRVPNWGGPYTTKAGADPSTARQADYRSLSPGALSVIRMQLVDGRDFLEADDITGPPVVIVDEQLASRTWPGESPIGKRIGVDPWVQGKPDNWASVIGVVRHVRLRSPIEEGRDQVYFAQRQVLRNPSVFVVRAGVEADALVAPIRSVLQRLDPQLPLSDVRPLSAYVEDARGTRRFTMVLAVLFAVAALALASVGIYGVVAYAVAARHHEFGVRLALGARARQVVALVAQEGFRLVLRGLVLGAVGAAGAGWLLRGLLFGVDPWDAGTFATAIPVLFIVAIAACILPARRATAASPVDALRAD